MKHWIVMGLALLSIINAVIEKERTNVILFALTGCMLAALSLILADLDTLKRKIK